MCNLLASSVGLIADRFRQYSVFDVECVVGPTA